jgi:tetratricopeptide (TPR) repeat protein
MLLRSLFLCCALTLSSFAAILLATVRGECIGKDGQPMAGSTVRLLQVKNGRHYEIQVARNGKFFSGTVEPGVYDVILLQGQTEVVRLKAQSIDLGQKDNVFDFDLASGIIRAMGNVLGDQPDNREREALEQARFAQKESAERAKRAEYINQEIAHAKELEASGDWNGSIVLLRRLAADEHALDLPWAALADAQFGGGATAESIDSFQKAIAIRDLAVYRNHMARSFQRLGKVDEAAEQYANAAALDPQSTADNYQNAGIVLFQAGEKDDSVAGRDRRARAIEYLRKALATRPDSPQALYLKALALLRDSVRSDGSVTSVAEIRESLTAYLRLAPNGPKAKDANELLASLPK